MIKDNNYSNVHMWLRHHYGSANQCENRDCLGDSKYFTWALIKGFKYEKKRENYMQLCGSCHLRYDMTEETKKKLSQATVLPENKRKFFSTKTHCNRGHEYTFKNTYRAKGKYPECRACKVLRNRIYRHKMYAMRDAFRLEKRSRPIEDMEGNKMNIIYEINQLTTNPFITEKILNLVVHLIEEEAKGMEQKGSGSAEENLAAFAKIYGYNQALEDLSQRLIEAVKGKDGDKK